MDIVKLDTLRTNQALERNEEFAKHGFNWIVFTPTEIRMLKRIFREELRGIKSKYGEKAMHQYTEQWGTKKRRLSRIDEMDLQDIIDEYPQFHGHTVVDEMNIRLGRSQKLPSGDVVPSDKVMEKEAAHYNKQQRVELRSAVGSLIKSIFTPNNIGDTVMADAKSFIDKFISKDKKIEELKKQLAELRKTDTDAMNKELHELIPGLPPEWVLIKKRNVNKPTSKKK